jgi:hypothetical protein
MKAGLLRAGYPTLSETSIDRKQNEETLDHTKFKAHFLPFLKSCISSISEI